MQLIISEYDKNELTIEQKVYLLEGVFEYLDRTDFDGWYSSEIQDLMKSQIAVYNNELTNHLPKVNLNIDELNDVYGFREKSRMRSKFNLISFTEGAMDKRK